MELLVIEEKLRREREILKERPFLQLEIEEYVEIKKNEPEVEPKIEYKKKTEIEFLCLATKKEYP